MTPLYFRYLIACCFGTKSAKKPVKATIKVPGYIRVEVEFDVEGYEGDEDGYGNGSRGENGRSSEYVFVKTNDVSDLQGAEEAVEWMVSKSQENVESVQTRVLSSLSKWDVEVKDGHIGWYGSLY